MKRDEKPAKEANEKTSQLSEGQEHMSKLKELPTYFCISHMEFTSKNCKGILNPTQYFWVFCGGMGLTNSGTAFSYILRLSKLKQGSQVSHQLKKRTTEYVNLGEQDVLCDPELKKEASVLTYGFVIHRRMHAHAHKQEGKHMLFIKFWIFFMLHSYLNLLLTSF